MRARYSDPAADELGQAVSYFLEHTLSVAADFADSIDRAVAQLAENPYLAQETARGGIRR